MAARTMAEEISAGLIGPPNLPERARRAQYAPESGGRNPPMKRLSCVLVLVLVASAAVAQSPSGQAYPSKPIKIVVPFSPGGSTDITARAVGQKLSEAWRQPVIVDNRVGAGCMIGADAVA